jgi:[ribosomal protein S18]-alanine N-acetyltransferase
MQNAILTQPTRRMRAMRDSDLPQVLLIERRAQAFPWPLSFFRQCLRHGCSCWVLTRGDLIQGYGVMALERGRAHVMNLCVRPEWRHRGLGKQILGRLLRIVRHRGIHAAYLEVRPTNRVARRFYKRQGFNQTGARNAYYPAKWGREDALILTRRL